MEVFHTVAGSVSIGSSFFMGVSFLPCFSQRASRIENIKDIPVPYPLNDSFSG